MNAMGWVVVACATLGTVASVHAEPAGAEAETLFRRGQELLAQGKLAEACAAFDGAQKLDPTTSTQLNRASCREKNGQLATAWGLFLEAERETRGSKERDAAKWHKLAADRAAKLAPRLSTLTISVPADAQSDGLEILRDGNAVDAVAWNQALPVDGGDHTITARAPGNAEWTTTLSVATERDAKTVLIPKLRPVVQPTVPPPAVAAAEVPTAPAPASAPAARSHTIAIITGAAGVAMLGGALGLELWASSTYDQSKKERDPAKQDSLWHSANNKRYVAEGFAVAGVATAGVAVWLYLRDRGDDHETARGVAWNLVPSPVVSGDRAGLQLGGSF